MSASIKYGSVELPIRDVEGVVADWVNRYQPLGETQLFGSDPGLVSNRWNVGHGASKTNWARPNYPDVPQMRINSLYWPTGASRYTRGLFLASGDQLATILNESSNGSRPLTLIISDGNGNRISTSLYLLPARPISTITTSQPLYLLPLVDTRYFGQFMSSTVTIGQRTGISSWSGLLSAGVLIDNALDAYFADYSVDTVSADYLKPDYLFGQYQFGSRDTSYPVAFIDNSADTSIPILTDAAAHSTGMRYVKQFSGGVSISRFDSAWATVQASMSAYRGQLIAGGELSNVAVPAAVQVFGPERTFTEGVILDTNRLSSRWYREVTAPSGFTTLPYSIYPVRKIFTSCLEVNNSAPYSSLGDLTPDNITELNTLADKIGADFYASQAHFYDLTYAGVVPWTFTPFCDHVLIVCDVVDGEFRMTTRVQSSPPGFGCTEMNHQTIVNEIYPDVCYYVGVQDGGAVPAWPTPNAKLNGSHSLSSHLVSVDYGNWALVEDNGTSGSNVDSVFGMAAYDRKTGYWQAITADMQLS